jgi:Putative restriction endonuclease
LLAAQNERPQAVIACAVDATYSEGRGDAMMSTHDETMPAGTWDVPIPPKSSMTEEEFVAWSFKENVRAEWIDGEVTIMSPSNLEHVELFGFLNFVLRGYVERHDLGKLLGSEFLVRFANQKRDACPICCSFRSCDARFFAGCTLRVHLT